MKFSIDKYLFVLLAIYAIILLSACFWPFNFFVENRVTVDSEGLVFSDPGTVYTEGAATGLETLREFTYVLELSAAIPGQPSWIISHGLDFDALNLLIGLYVDHLIVETHRGNQTMRASIKGALQKGKRTWLVVVGTPGQLRVYLDGKLKREITRDHPDSTLWDASYPLVMGARSDGKYPWEGVLYRLAIFDVAASEEEIRMPEALVASHPLARYEFRNEAGRRIVNTGTGETGPLIIPDRFVPFRRMALMDIEDLWDPTPVWRDITLNVLAFVPPGILLSLLLGRAFHPVVVVLLVLAAAFGLSLSIEMLQVFLPGRWSTFTDVATNSLGALFGGLIWFLGAGRLRGMRFRNAGIVSPESKQDM